MEKMKLVDNLKEVFTQATHSLVAAINELRADMNTQLDTIAKARAILDEDADVMEDINQATADFASDLEDIVDGVTYTIDSVDSILDDLDSVPDTLDALEEEDEVDPDDEDDTDEDEVEDDQPDEAVEA